MQLIFRLRADRPPGDLIRGFPERTNCTAPLQAGTGSSSCHGGSWALGLVPVICQGGPVPAPQRTQPLGVVLLSSQLPHAASETVSLL